jgi:hypothetical protein
MNAFFMKLLDSSWQWKTNVSQQDNIALMPRQHEYIECSVSNQLGKGVTIIKACI